MAYIVPSDMSQLKLDGAHDGEIGTLAKLKDELSSDYTVFHGVHWSQSHKWGMGFGEIDFVIINKVGQILVIEQKNGPLVEGPNGLVKNYADGSGKDPVSQINRSIDKLRQSFKELHGSGRRLEIDYIIYLPEHTVKKLNAAAIDKSRVIDAPIKSQLANRIDQYLGPGKPDGSDWSSTVDEFFRQTFEIVANVTAHIDAHDQSFDLLSTGLANVLSNIEVTPTRLRVRGTAGCGKSAVASRFYREAIEAGQRPLLVCYTRPLRERLNAALPSGGKVQTWNGLCDEFLSVKGHTIDYNKMGDPNFWQDIANLVIGEDVPDDWKFDLLIVDEGQDFEPAWLDILELFQTEQKNVIWLEDPDQNLFGKDPVDLTGFVGYRCADNYRSPESISRYIQKHLPFDFKLANDLPGLPVDVHRYKTVNAQPVLVKKAVDNLIKFGFGTDEIVILTCRGLQSSVFSKVDKVGTHPLARFTGTYDADGAQQWTAGKIRFDTVRRFKGQQAPAVILIDVDDDISRPELHDRLLFCGMTRATVKLDLVVNDSHRLAKS
jgi:hypothetical protein